jgi:hypothetical protein
VSARHPSTCGDARHLCDVSAVLLVFLTFPHAPSYSSLRTEAMRGPYFLSHDFARRRPGRWEANEGANWPTLL